MDRDFSLYSFVTSGPAPLRVLPEGMQLLTGKKQGLGTAEES